MSDDSHRLPRIRISELRQRIITTDVIRIDGGIDHPENRFVRKLPNCCNDLWRQLFVFGIDQKNAIVADLSSDVAARTGQQVNVSLNRNRPDLDIVQICRSLKTGQSERQE
jgi:hypothetical protein